MENRNPNGILRCLRCKSYLDGSGREPYRFICPNCNQHYAAVMQLIPIEDNRPNLLPENNDVEPEPSTGAT